MQINMEFPACFLFDDQYNIFEGIRMRIITSDDL